MPLEIERALFHFMFLVLHETVFDEQLPCHMFRLNELLVFDIVSEHLILDVVIESPWSGREDGVDV